MPLRKIEPADGSTEGHARKPPVRPAVSASDPVVSDAEGHRYIPRDERLPIGGSSERSTTPATPIADAETEGHPYRK